MVAQSQGSVQLHGAIDSGQCTRYAAACTVVNSCQTAAMARSKTTPLQRRQLGAALKAHRTAAKMTLADVAKHFEWSTSKPSRMEVGKVEATARDVRDLLDLYQVADQAERERLIELTRGSRETDDSYYRFTDLLPRQFSNYLGLEAQASILRMHDPVLIPGLFQ